MKSIGAEQPARISMAGQIRRMRGSFWRRLIYYGNGERRPPSTIARWVLIGVISLLVLGFIVLPALSRSGYYDRDVRWQLVHVSAEEPIVIIRSAHSVCEELRAPEADESARRVVISIPSVVPPVDCPAISAFSYHIVELEGQLAGRELGGCGSESCTELVSSAD